MRDVAARCQPQEWEFHGHAFIERALARQVDDVDGGLMLELT
jgi:hypothetical protein